MFTCHPSTMQCAHCLSSCGHALTEAYGWQDNIGHFLLVWPWPWPDDLRIRTRPVLTEDVLDVQIWTSYVMAFESYCLTDRHIESTENIYHTASRVLKNTTKHVNKRQELKQKKSKYSNSTRYLSQTPSIVARQYDMLCRSISEIMHRILHVSNNDTNKTSSSWS